MKEECRVNSWESLHNHTATSIFRRRGVEFIATASPATKCSARQQQRLSRDSECRRQFYMFRKVSGNSSRVLDDEWAGFERGSLDGSTFCDG